MDVSRESALTDSNLRVLARVASSAVFLIGVCILVCWASCLLLGSGIWSFAHSMHPLTAFLFAVCGFGLWKSLPGDEPLPERTRRIVHACGIVAVLAATLSLADVFGLNISLERLIASASGDRGRALFLAQGMGPITAMNFLFCGLALLLLDYQSQGGLRPAQTLVVSAITVSLMAMIVYTYKLVAFYRVGSGTPIALLTAFSFTLWCIGALASRPNKGVMAIINGPTTGGAMARRLLPMAILIPWILGGLRWMGESAGYYDTEFGVALFAVATILIFTGVVWWNATLLHKADLERRKTEDRLRKATLDLERSNKELQQFAYVASHDLFEPLRMITSYLQLLQQTYQGKLDAKGDEFIGFAIDGARRMRALIEDLLAYSRLDSRGAVFKDVDCDFAVKAAISNLKVAIEESRGEVKIGPLPHVLGDVIQLTQVFQNLIGNALKFRGDEPPVVEIGSVREGKNWIIRVRDNGIGIAPEHFERVFVIFQRLHTRREYPGTGMGLAISKKIIERHGGKIWVESAPGKGSTFLISLPAIPEQTSEEEPKNNSSQNSSPEQRP